jgi:hypothetical protein
MKEYLWEQWKRCNNSKYYKYFEEWYKNMTDIQKSFAIAWSKGLKTI